jgi:hypothetical protein
MAIDYMLAGRSVGIFAPTYFLAQALAHHPPLSSS